MFVVCSDKLLGMEVRPKVGLAVILLVVGGAPIVKVISSPAQTSAEPKVAMTEAGAGSNTHGPDIEATTEANCPRGGDGDPGPGHRCGGRCRGG